jgi:hypothetical protein
LPRRIPPTDIKSVDALVAYVISEMQSLTKLGFSEPGVESTNLTRSVIWTLGNDALEVEIDLHDAYAGFCIIRLEDGKRPDGVYHSHGAPCRLHLHKIFPLPPRKPDKRVTREARRFLASPETYFDVLVDEFNLQKEHAFSVARELATGRIKPFG